MATTWMYEFLTPATRDEHIAYQKNKETTDMSIDARLETDNYAETKKWGITAPFITMQLARVTPVSYTHLDVYKRQNLLSVCHFGLSLRITV